MQTPSSIAEPFGLTVDPSETQSESDRARMWYLATGLLVGTAALYAVVILAKPTGWWVGPVLAGLEAALVGGCADWFAVTVLFRRPLGLPIPHSAIIPRNKDRIAANLGKFISQNFLVARLFEHKEAQALSFARSIGRWLGREGERRVLAQQVASALSQSLSTGAMQHQWNLVEDLASGAFRSTDGRRLLKEVLSIVSDDRYLVPLIRNCLEIAQDFIDRNGAELRQLGSDAFPWFVPRWVEEAVVDKVGGKLRVELGRLLEEDAHPLRLALVHRLKELPERLREHPDAERLFRDLVDQLSRSDTFRETISQMRARFVAQIQADVTQPNSATIGMVDELLGVFGTKLVEDGELRSRLDTLIRGLLGNVMEEYREELEHMITDTVKSWDDTMLVEKLESQVGKDLQFVRINGTIVGGVIGIVIYGIGQLLAMQ